MWLVKSALTNQSDKVNDLLKEGFEPFWGYTYETEPGKKPTVRMYFKKDNVPANFKARTIDYKIQVDRTELDQVMTDVVSVLSDLQVMVDAVKGLQPPLVSLEGGHVDLSPDKVKASFADLPVEEDGIDHAVIEDQLIEDSIVNDPVVERKNNDDPPVGDSFRVVDEVPPEAQGSARTPAQEATIQKIRDTSKTNITINPALPNGIVIVTRGKTVFEIEEDGTMLERETNANVDSKVI